MSRSTRDISRRQVLAGLCAVGTAAALPGHHSRAAVPNIIEKTIPASGERLPAIGMGSWLTFNVGPDPALRAARVEVLRAFLAAGGTIIDSSPMYGSSEDVIGFCLQQLGGAGAPFTATKVWTPFKWLGIRQMEASERLWHTRRFDLMQIHNLLDWQTHLETLLEWKANGRVRYIGVTTSHGRRHDELEKIMTSQPIDFVQLTYNILDREAEERLLPLAVERNLAVIANRPFRRGALFDHFAERPLPAWAGEIGCGNWAQYFLKFIVSHPAVTCAIPATSRVDHMVENMGALSGPLPDAAMRARMTRYLESV